MPTTLDATFDSPTARRAAASNLPAVGSSTAGRTATSDLLDARPKLPTTLDSFWDKAKEECDRIAGVLDKTIRDLGLLVWVRKSKPGEYPLYVLVDNWRPMHERDGIQATDRSSLKITIRVEPYKEKPLDYTAELQRQNKHWTASFWEMRTEELEGMARYLVNGGAKPKFFKPRIDPLLLIIGSLIPPVLWLTMPKNRLVKEARPTRFTLPIVLGWSGLLGACAFFLLWSAETQSYRGGDEMAGLYMIGAILSAFAFVTGVVMASRRPRLIALPSQSLRTPRHEFLVDSWHVSVPEAGKEFAQFKQRIVNAISNLDPSIEINEELHQQLSPRGFDERMRHVLTKGQANVHVHVYPYGRDAFVGWDGYLNFARWAETEPISKNIQSGARVEYRSLTTGVHVPTEFDLMELNALSETVHRAMVHEIEAFLKEREIEADLDFTIIRGDRERAMIAGKEYERDAGGTTQKHYFGRRRM